MKKVTSFNDYEQILVNYIYYITIYTNYQVVEFYYGNVSDFFPKVIC